jgi:hypothetical protein
MAIRSAHAQAVSDLMRRFAYEDRKQVILDAIAARMRADGEDELRG